MRVPELDSRNKKMLAAGAALALGAAAYRSIKVEGDNLTFDFSVWGDRSRRVFADVIDDTKQAYGRITGRLILGSDNKVIDVEDIEFTEGGADPIKRTEALERAVSDTEGWSGQSER